jgi:predicted ArsR family transcriptional regulator
MELPPTPEHDVLALPIRARLFEALAGLRRPATTQQPAVLVGRHPNTVRVQLRRMADAGLLECRRLAQRRGRPRHEWAILSSARPAGQPPQAYGELSRWPARAVGVSEQLPRIEHVGREIGRELAPQAEGRQLPEAMLDVLTSLGFAPRSEPHGPDGIRYVLGNCPYRDAVAASPAVVCTLHRGITTGLLDKLRPQAQLQDFVARDRYAAGCLIDLTSVAGPGAAA